MAGKELSTIEIIHLIQELKRMEKAEDPKSWRENIFRQIPEEFKVAVNLRNEDEIAELLKRRV